MSTYIALPVTSQYEFPAPDIITQLAKAVGGIRLSLYLKICYSAETISQVRNTLKKELKAADTALRQRGMHSMAIEAILEPARQFIEDPEKLQGHPASLVLFLSEEGSIIMDIPHSVDNSLTVSNRYYLKPILSYMTDIGDVYLLLLNRDNTRMQHLRSNRLESIDIPQMPKSINETTAFDDPEKSMQQHVGERVAAKGRAGSQPGLRQHGQGGAKDIKSEQYRRFNAQVAQAVSHFLSGSPCTLIVIGDSSNTGQFNQTARLGSHRVINYVGNPETFTEEALREYCTGIAREIADDIVKTKIREIEGMPLDRVETTIPNATVAAFQGAIDSCVICLDEVVIGVMNTETEEVKLRPDEHGNDCAHDLLDLIAQETIRHGGNVFAVHSDRMPNNFPVLAQRRY